VRASLGRLDETDLARQVGLIRASFYARIAGQERGTGRAVSGSAPPAAPDAEALPPLDGAELTRHALAIAGELRRRAIVAPDGSVAWIGMEHVVGIDRFQLQPLGFDLYNGTGGVALFLAALEHVTGGAGYRDLALGALHTPRRRLRDDPAAARLADQIGIGGGVGLGSIVYVLTRAGQLLADPLLLKDAGRAAALITPERISADTTLDLMGGAAGAIPALLALHAATGDRDPLERAARCGRHLLERRAASASGLRSWRTSGGKLLAGLSHGSAGIAYALLRLHQATADERLREAAREAIAFEATLFVPEAGNWPMLYEAPGQDGVLGFRTTWCHGAAGIGLARLGGLGALDTPEVRADIDVALAATRRAPLEDVDHLCCGNFGRIDVLISAALRLGRPELLELAGASAAWIVARASRGGVFQLFHDLPREVYNPSFFRGAAGIGYELLRLAEPRRLPSALLWE
jgi:type 2 lantibiotic biosynthesis protein LanM